MRVGGDTPLGRACDFPKCSAQTLSLGSTNKNRISNSGFTYDNGGRLAQTFQFRSVILPGGGRASASMNR